jgi:predicted DNA-binding transcriptional regulator
VIPRLSDARHDPELRDSALRVYLCFIFDLSPVEWREKKVSVIALDTRLSERTVEGAIAQLIRRGYIEAGTRVPGSPQTYRLVWSAKQGDAA